MPVVWVDAIAYHGKIDTGHLAEILLLSLQPWRRKLLPSCSGCSAMLLLCYAYESHNIVGHVG